MNVLYVGFKGKNNAAYFHMLKKYTGRVVFVHIPSSKNMSEEMFVNLRKVIERIQNEY